MHWEAIQWVPVSCLLLQGIYLDMCYDFFTRAGVAMEEGVC